MAMPYDTSLDDVLIKIRQSYNNPSVGEIRTTVLKEGPRAFKIASLMEILDKETGDFHHFSLKIDHIDRTKGKGWNAKPEQSARLEGKDDPSEIEKLYRFLHAAIEITTSGGNGELHVVRGEAYKAASKILEAIPDLKNTEKLEVIKALMRQLGESEEDIGSYMDVLADTEIGVLRHFAAASRFLEYRNAYQELEKLIDSNDTSETDLQNHLNSNPWIFGSEYSKLLKRRSWTRDENLDFMLRRTVDGYLEIVEIKKAKAKSLFNYDQSHNSYYPSPALSAVLGQTFKYIEATERNRDSILAHDRDDPLKIRARLIIGRDGDENQRAALRNLNDHLHSIEVITYDQLLRIAKRVLEVFYDDKALPNRTLPLTEYEDEIPF